MPTYFAHSAGDSDKDGWQPLDLHLSEVARRCGDFASKFGVEAWGKACGLLHDLGKFSREFQARLEGGRRVDHATAGARQAVALFGPGPGRLLAYAIAGHHTGLPDGGAAGGPRRDTLFGRLDRGKVEVPEIRDFEPVMDGMPASLPRPPVGRDGFSRAFFVRMLYSCLVDADFLDTEAWLARRDAALRARWPAIEALLEHLDRYLDAICCDDTPVNRRRAEVLARCREAAARPPGIFSLTVPTGGGKTLSSLAFALRHAALHGLDRVIYAIPFTSIIEQNAAVFRNALGPLGSAVVEHHSNYEPPAEDEDEVRPGRRWRLASENWDAPLVVTTNVQLFESLFAAKGSRCRKLHNVARSVLILDEAQALPTALLQPCLAALRQLAASYGATIVLCTATQPALHRSRYLPCGFAENEVREIVPNHLELYQTLQRVDVQHEGPLRDDEVVARLRTRPQALCIVNTRRHARQLFERLGRGHGHFHLSALMCPAHRAEKLSAIRARLAAGEPCRVVSTQLVEAGVDLDFPFVLRAAAGVDAIAQAAGRCNREGRLPTRGQVSVFEPECGVPAGQFSRAAGLGTLTARAFPDLLSPEAVHHYFTQLYSFEGSDGLDAKGILPRFEENAAALSFPFREVAEEFHLIQDDMQPLIIPWSDEARELIRELRHTESPAATARRLQRYTVSLYRQTFADLKAARVVESYADRFHVLTNDCIYDDDVGLCPEDPTHRSVEADIF